MGVSLEQFSSECHRILKQDPGVEGRKKVCALVQDVLKDDDFVATHLGAAAPLNEIAGWRSGAGFSSRGLGHVTPPLWQRITHGLSNPTPGIGGEPPFAPKPVFLHRLNEPHDAFTEQLGR